MRPLLFETREDRSAPPAGLLAEALAGYDVVSGALPLELPSGTDRPLVVFHDRAWLEILDGAHADATREQVGVCYGHSLRDRGRDFVVVTRAYRARTSVGSRVHVTLDARAWDDIHAQRGHGLPGEAVVGWWHTHPDLGAYFSGVDQRTQAQAFPRSWHFGLVLDPVRDEALLFRGGDGTPTGLPPIVIARSRPTAAELPYSALALALDEAVDGDGNFREAELDATRRPVGRASGGSEPLAAAGTSATAGTGLPPQTPPGRTRRTAAPARPTRLGSGDLARAAWLALARARAGTTLVPLSSRAGRTALIFDRPALKRRFPALREQLSAGRTQYPLTLPLELGDVVAMLWSGVLLPPHSAFFRSRP